MKKALKICLIVVLIMAIIFGGFVFLLVGSYERVKTNINQYSNDVNEIANAAKFMPDLETLTGYTEIEYTYKIKCYSTLAGFYSDSFALFVSYDEEKYAAAKNKALTEHSFLQQPVMCSVDTYTLPVTEFEYNGYTMKVVPDEEYIDFCACKSFMLVGFNDEECKIAYLYYYDFDIDYIAEVGDDLEDEMCKLIDTAFSWVD